MHTTLVCAAVGLGHSIGRSTSGLRCYAVAATAVKPPAAAVKEAHGFVLDRQQYISEYDSHVLIYKHKKTGEPNVIQKKPKAVNANVCSCVVLTCPPHQVRS
jgi:hypothetical protein